MSRLQRSRKLRQPRRPITAVLVALMAAGVLLLPGAHAAPVRFEQVGAIPSVGPVYADGPARLLYQFQGGLTTYLQIYNLDTLAPRGARLQFDQGLVPFAAVPLRGAGMHMQFVLAATDVVKHRLLYPTRDANGGAVVSVIDGLAGKTTATWAVPSPVSGMATGFGVEAIEYDAPTDTAYLVTATPIAATTDAFVGEIYVQAVNATTGAAKWSYRVPECTTLFADSHIAPPFGVKGGRAYLGCATGAQANGVAEIMRMTLGTGGAAPTGLEVFAAPIYPRRGAFDAVNERMYFLDSGSLLATFDGAHDAWVGLVDPNARPQLGFDASVGRLYLCRAKQTKGGGLFSTDAGLATPVPPGTEQTTINCPALESWPMVVDPVTHRLFVEQTGTDSVTRWTALIDHQAAYVAPAAFDPDLGAEDVAEQDGVTQSSFSSQGAAYGTKVILVGGPLGAVQNASPLLANLLRGEIGHQAKLKLAEGSRQVRFARVPAVKISDSGVESASIVADRDNATDNDLSTIRQHPATAAVNSATGKTEPKDQQPQWPYSLASCFTFGGETDVPTASAPKGPEGGTADASCDFKKLTGKAQAESDRVDINGLVTVGYSSANVVSSQDDKLGAVTKATAVARNISIGGSVSIAEISATATAFAHGRPGTADTKYERLFSGVKVTQPGSSNVIYSCDTPEAGQPKSCDPAAVVAAINQALGPRILVRLPDPSKAMLHGSPKGSTASFQQDEFPQTEERLLFDKPVEDLTMAGFEVRVAANVGTASGFIAQLAGVTATSGYRVFRLPQVPTLDLPAEPIVGGISVDAPPEYTGLPSPPPLASAPPGPTTTLRKIESIVKHGFRVAFGSTNGFRSVLAAWALLLSPVYLGMRRRSFAKETA